MTGAGGVELVIVHPTPNDASAFFTPSGWIFWKFDMKQSSTSSLYNYRWQKARLRHLAKFPLCVMCQAAKPPRVTAASVVDHRIPHRGDLTLFWRESNWQSLCATHHNSDKQMLEKSGRKRVTFGPDGNPVGQEW